MRLQQHIAATSTNDAERVRTRACFTSQSSSLLLSTSAVIIQLLYFTESIATTGSSEFTGCEFVKGQWRRGPFGRSQCTADCWPASHGRQMITSSPSE